MPSSYEYPKDGKFHTRYSELVNCTPMGVQWVVKKRRAQVNDFENFHMLLGTTRHEECAAESRETGKPASCFFDNCPELNSEYNQVAIEQEIAAEIFPGIVLHSTADFRGFNGCWTMVDYKFSSANPRSFLTTKQHLVYGLQMLARDELCEKFYYAVERWNPEKTEINGHSVVSAKINRNLIMGVKPWLWDRVCTLQEALETIPA